MKKWMWSVAGIVGGVMLGYAYYRLVGCRTGACPLQSSPYFTLGLGALLGWTISDEIGRFLEKRRNRIE